jgi:hypothetical protein
MKISGQTYLDESDGGRLFAEALAAEVETVFADETSLVGAETAVPRKSKARPGELQQ